MKESEGDDGLDWQRGDPDSTHGPVALDESVWESAALASDGMALLDEKWQIIDFNPSALELLHCTSPVVVGRDFWGMVPDAIAEKHQNLVLEALASSEQHSFTAHQQFEGSWIQYSFRRLATGYVVNLRDVASTQRLQGLLEDSERFNQLIFEANPNVMWLFDATSLHILAVNQAAVEFYLIARERFVLLKMGALFPDGEGASLLSELGRGRGMAATSFAPLICKQKKMDGHLVLVELACSRVVWHGHQAILASIADVSDRHLADRTLRRENVELELELARLKDELTSTQRDLASFTYALSHDLQGPLHAVNGFSTLLINNYAALLDKAGQHYVHRIQASSGQLAKLVDDLKTLVQLPAFAAQPQQIDLHAVCSSLMDHLRKLEPERLVAVELQAGLTVSADRTLLTTALACLLANAWKFTSRRSDGWIGVALLAGETPAEAVLRISDNGAGFDPAYSDRLFTAFQRLHSAVEFPGNGLGLAIVKRVADRHAGRVWAETTATGASFFMSLPQGNAGLLQKRA